MRVYTEAEKCKRSSSSIFVPLPPSPGRQKKPESFKHLAGTQKEDIGTRFLLDADDDRGPEGLGHLREQEPFYREQVAGSVRSAVRVLCVLLLCLAYTNT